PLFEGHVDRIVEGLHGALFVDVGRVWDRHEPLTLEHLAANGGVGLRLVLRPGVIARLDYGVSDEESVAWFVFRLPF
ncbi:MAG: hypothetical protein HY608_05350, partial [Planctomycetes bacterium]|nr:hypothetical protein [Planctomycetota bacterium]